MRHSQVTLPSGHLGPREAPTQPTTVSAAQRQRAQQPKLPQHRSGSAEAGRVSPWLLCDVRQGPTWGTAAAGAARSSARATGTAATAGLTTLHPAQSASAVRRASEAVALGTSASCRQSKKLGMPGSTGDVQGLGCELVGRNNRSEQSCVVCSADLCESLEVSSTCQDATVVCAMHW